MKLNKIKILSFLLIVVFSSLFFANIVLAQVTTGGNTTSGTKSVDCRGIVPCCEASGCNFDELIKAVKKVVNWGVELALMFTVVVIAYAGFLYLTSAANPGQRGEANKMFVKVIKGMFFILAAWLIVTLIMSALAKDVPIFLKN